MIRLNKVRRDAPWRWLQAGLADFRRAPGVCLAYGLIFATVGLIVVAGLWALDLAAAIPVALSGFALVAPGLAVGIYQVCRTIEAGDRPRFRVIVSPVPGRTAQIAMLSLLLLLLLLAWVRIAQFLLAIIAPDSPLSPGPFMAFALGDANGLALLIVGTLVGAVLAAAAFAMSAIAFPMLVDQDVDVVTAVVASFTAVLRQPFVMLTWAWLIAAMTAAGAAVFVLGLAVTFPVVALATWHAYRDFAPEPVSSGASSTA